SATLPALPAGNTKFIRIGAMKTDGSNNLYRTQQSGRDTIYVITAATNTANYPSNAGANGASSWTLRGGMAPPTAAAAKVLATQPAPLALLRAIRRQKQL